MNHKLEDHHKEHLKRLGVEEIPDELSCPRYSEDYAHWRRALPDASHRVWHMKALGHEAWRQHAEKQRAKEALQAGQIHVHPPAAVVVPAPEVKVHSSPVTVHFPKAEIRIVIAAILLLLGLIVYSVFGPKAHAQFSKVAFINWQQGGSNISGGFFTYPFNINCSSNLTCTPSGNTMTIVAGSGATVAWDAILNPTAGGLLLTQFANGNNFFTVKRKTDTAPTGSFFDFQTAAGADLCKLDITGTFSACAFPYANLTGTPTLPANTTSTAHNFFTAYNSSTGAFTKAQPACADLSDASAFCNGTAYSSLTGVPSTFAPSAHNLLSAQHGDTVAHTPVLGDVIFANSTPAWAALAGQTTTTKEYLSQAGNGTVSAAPAWAQVAFADLSGSHSCAQSPALTGDVTSSAGSCATTVGAIQGKAIDTPTTKGDIFVYNGSAIKRLGVGTDTQVLTADSTQATGLKWAAGGGGGGTNGVFFGMGWPNGGQSLSGANAIQCTAFWLNVPVAPTRFDYFWSTGDAGHTQDIGVYGPITSSGQASVPKVFSLGGVTNGSGEFNVAINPGTINPGWYMACWTSSGTTAQISVGATGNGGGIFTLFDRTNSSTTATAGVLPSTVNAPSNNVGGTASPYYIVFYQF